MNDLHFDDFVKKQMSDQTADVPGHVLENVIAARKKSNPKGFWMFFKSKNLLIAAIILLLTSGGYLLVSQKNSSPNKSTPNIQSSNPGKENTIIENNDGGISKTKSEDVANIKSKEQQNLSRGNNPNQTVNTNNISIPGTASIPHKSTYSNVLPHESIANATILIHPSTPENNEAGKVITDNNEKYYNRVLFPFTFANTKALLNEKKLNPKLNFPSCPTIEQNAAGNKKYYEIYAGPDFPIGNYKTAIPDSAANNYLQKRKEASKISSAYSAGIRYTKVFNNGMSVRTGVNYSQINEKFKYINQNELKKVTVITTRIIIRSPGDTLFINDTLQYQLGGTRIKTTYNHYRNIDIPLVLGYELGNGRLHANINAGVIINVYSWYKGDVLDTAYQPVSITSGKNSAYQFENNIGVGFLGGVSVYYKLTDKLHLLLEPYFRYNLSPMSKGNLNLEQKYHTSGIRAGLRFDLK